jgi:hypothetical protein
MVPYIFENLISAKSLGAQNKMWCPIEERISSNVFLYHSKKSKKKEELIFFIQIVCFLRFGAAQDYRTEKGDTLSFRFYFLCCVKLYSLNFLHDTPHDKTSAIICLTQNLVNEHPVYRVSHKSGYTFVKGRISVICGPILLNFGSF